MQVLPSFVTTHSCKTVEGTVRSCIPPPVSRDLQCSFSTKPKVCARLTCFSTLCFMCSVSFTNHDCCCMVSWFNGFCCMVSWFHGFLYGFMIPWFLLYGFMAFVSWSCPCTMHVFHGIYGFMCHVFGHAMSMHVMVWFMRLFN